MLPCHSCESREKVDALVAKALAAGGSTHAAPKDYGFMYQHSITDPDGHHGVSEALYLHDPDANGVELDWDRPVEE